MSIPVLIEGQRYKVAPHGRSNPSLYTFIGTFVERIDVTPTPSSSSSVHFKFIDCIKRSGQIIPEFILTSPRLFEFVLQAPEPASPSPGPLANTPSISYNYNVNEPLSNENWAAREAARSAGVAWSKNGSSGGGGSTGPSGGGGSTGPSGGAGFSRKKRRSTRKNRRTQSRKVSRRHRRAF